MSLCVECWTVQRPARPGFGRDSPRGRQTSPARLGGACGVPPASEFAPRILLHPCVQTSGGLRTANPDSPLSFWPFLVAPAATEGFASRPQPSPPPRVLDAPGTRRGQSSLSGGGLRLASDLMATPPTARPHLDLVTHVPSFSSCSGDSFPCSRPPPPSILPCDASAMPRASVSRPKHLDSAVVLTWVS